MASHAKIVNETNGFRVKQSRAARAVAEFSAEWVEYGVSIRNLTLAESIAARNEHARLREPLELSELRGIKFEPPTSGIQGFRNGLRLAWEANKFAQA